MMLSAIAEAQGDGARLAQACRVVGLSMRTIERWRNEPERGDGLRGPHHRPHNALSPAEEGQVVSVLTSSRYAGLSPKQLVPQLADEGLYLASESTIYRVQRRYGLRAKKRAQSRTHVTRACTIHRATGPNQVWSWDITLLPTTVRGVYLRLYLVMDVWSRRIVGWRVSERESAELAAELVTQACREGNVGPGLVLHSDNGAPMRGSTMIATLQWLGVVPSFSRPHVSDDNPYSEALFRTLKHTPAYPRLPFADLGSAERWVTRFVNPLRHAERAAPWQRASCPRSSAGPLRASTASKPRALDPHDSQLVSGWPRGPQSRTHPAAGCCMTHATTTLIFTAKLICHPVTDLDDPICYPCPVFVIRTL